MTKLMKNLFRKNIIPIVGTVVIFTTCPILADVLENKSSNFDSVLSKMGSGAEERSKSDFAAKIREQRSKLDSKEETNIAKKSSAQGVNKCDQSLRECMKEKCGKNFEGCYTDDETIWGDKLDSCRRNTECTGHEYAILAPEIAADRDFNIRISVYQDIIDCGKEYNACIFTNCGTTLDNCVAKSDGDAVIEKCKEIADKCKEQDSGMAGRAMETFGTLRQHAIAQAREDEERMYKLRETMESACKAKGAMFDQRSLVCVYTVNFFAGDQPEHPMASKKLYAGGTFQCTPEWFGIDVTTFKENAYRLTRSEKAASSAALGAGLGTAASTFTSGQIQQAIKEKGVSWKPGEEGKSVDQIKQERQAKKGSKGVTESGNASGDTTKSGEASPTPTSGTENKPSNVAGTPQGDKGGNNLGESDKGKEGDDKGGSSDTPLRMQPKTAAEVSKGITNNGPAGDIRTNNETDSKTGKDNKSDNKNATDKKDSNNTNKEDVKQKKSTSTKDKKSKDSANTDPYTSINKSYENYAKERKQSESKQKNKESGAQDKNKEKKEKGQTKTDKNKDK